MKTLIPILMLLVSSCALFKEAKTSRPEAAKTAPPVESKKFVSKKITGTLPDGTLYVANSEPEGYVVSFDPALKKRDIVFEKATSHLLGKLYNDKLKGKTRISIETNIDYTIVDGKKGRYKIVPVKGPDGRIGSYSIENFL